jgi:hypothetical protein
MPDTTDWYERGCSRGCRNKHTLVWGWCDLAEEPKPRLNLHVFETFTASDGNASGKFRQVTTEEARAELAKFEPEPTWRDVIRAFLAIGPYLLERVSTGGTTRWRYETDKRTKGGLRELVDVFHYASESIWLIKLGLHGDTHMVSLKNPKPAEVLAARLVGLGGGDA